MPNATPTSDTPPPAQSPDAADVRVLLTTITPGKARTLAVRLVDERLAACVNLVPGLRSLYRWKDGLCDEPETLLVIKTSAAREAELTRRLGELHPYEVPEVLSFTPSGGLSPYLAWILGSTTS